MDRIIQIVLVCVLLSGCSILKKSTDSIKVDFEELNYGLVSATDQYSKPDQEDPTGTHSYSAFYKLIEKTDSINVNLGDRIGVQYNLKSNVNKWVPVRQVWIFPSQMINDKGEKFDKLDYIINRPTNDNRWANYKFEEEYELLKGKWIFQVYFEGNKLYEKEFYLE